MPSWPAATWYGLGSGGGDGKQGAIAEEEVGIDIRSACATCDVGAIGIISSQAFSTAKLPKEAESFQVEGHS